MNILISKKGLKKCITLVAFFILINQLQAQDLLITTSNDSVNCKILKISDKYEVSYVDSNITKTKNFVNAQVKLVIIDYYQNLKINKAIQQLKKINSSNISESKINFKKLNDLQYPYKQFRLSTNAVYAYRYFFGNNSSDPILDKLMGQIRHNFGVLADAHIKVGKSKKALIGIQIGRIQSNGMVNDVYLISNGQTYTGNAELQINISTMGINLLMPIWKKNKNKILYISTGLNYVTYYEDFRVGYFNLVTESSTVATSIGVIYDYRLNKNWGFGCGATIDGGVLTDLNMDSNGNKLHVTLSNDKGIGLGRVVFSSGIKCYL